MELNSIPVPSSVQFRRNAVHYGTNPFTIVDIEKELSEFLELAKSKYSKKTFTSRIKVYAKYVKFLALPSVLARELESLGKQARLHVLRVMSAFAKFLDAKYNTDDFSGAFQRIRRSLGLKWYVSPGLPRIATRIIDPVEVITRIIPNIRSGKHKLFAIFMLATGLRTSEALDAWENFERYYKQLNGIHILEIMSDRRTKRAYFAFITKDVVEAIVPLRQFKLFRRIDDSKVWASWKEACQRAGLDHRAYPLYYLRKVHATLLRRVMDKELVDLLQGRAPKSVLDKYYNVESLKYLYRKYCEVMEPIVKHLLNTKS